MTTTYDPNGASAYTVDVSEATRLQTLLVGANGYGAEVTATLPDEVRGRGARLEGEFDVSGLDTLSLWVAAGLESDVPGGAGAQLPSYGSGETFDGGGASVLRASDGTLLAEAGGGGATTWGNVEYDGTTYVLLGGGGGGGGAAGDWASADFSWGSDVDTVRSANAAPTSDGDAGGDGATLTSATVLDTATAASGGDGAVVVDDTRIVAQSTGFAPVSRTHETGGDAAIATEPFFELTIESLTSPIASGEPITATVTVTNVGLFERTDTLTLAVSAGGGSDSTQFTLASGASETIDLTAAGPTVADAAVVDVTISTAFASQTQTSVVVTDETAQTAWVAADSDTAAVLPAGEVTATGEEISVTAPIANSDAVRADIEALLVKREGERLDGVFGTFKRVPTDGGGTVSLRPPDPLAPPFETSETLPLSADVDPISTERATASASFGLTEPRAISGLTDVGTADMAWAFAWPAVTVALPTAAVGQITRTRDRGVEQLSIPVRLTEAGATALLALGGRTEAVQTRPRGDTDAVAVDTTANGTLTATVARAPTSLEGETLLLEGVDIEYRNAGPRSYVSTLTWLRQRP